MKNSPQYTSACLLLALVSLLSACGGGGGGTTTAVSSSPVSDDPTPPADLVLSVVSPSAVSSARLTQGTPTIASARTSTGYGLASRVDIPAVNATGFSSSAVTDSNVQILPDIHITDTGAAAQWAEGWTGLGTTISVIDDFDTRDIAVASLPFTVSQTVNGASYDVTYEARFATTHGGLVSSIAGGGGATPTPQDNTVFLKAVSAAGAPTLSASTLQNLDISGFNVSIGSPVGVAKEASVLPVRLPVPLSVSDTFDALGRNLGSDVVNISLDNPLSATSTLASLQTQITSDPFSGQTVNAVVVVSAGNTAVSCAASNLNECNGLAANLALYPSTAGNVIIAGATTGTDENEDIASFSNRAGAFKERFLLAPGGTGFIDLNSRTEVVGTSFSAPRIAGAAALLRQKFPNLSGSDTTSILLLSANKDINNDDTPDFSGVSDVYGHGKLDLSSAMSPMGTLVAR